MSQVLSLPRPELDAADVPSRPAPPFSRVLTGLAGLALLGAAAGLGSGSAAIAARSVPSALIVGAGALALTSPALLVVHQVLALRAPPHALVAALARALVRLGALALGLTPFVLFFAATSGLAFAVFPLAFAAAAALSAAGAVRELVGAEVGAANPAAAVPMTALSLGWVGLTALVGLRLAVGVVQFVFNV